MIQVVLNNIVPYGGRYMTLGVDFTRRVRTQALSQLLPNFCRRHFERQRGINQQMAVWRGLQSPSRGAARCNFGGEGGETVETSNPARVSTHTCANSNKRFQSRHESRW